MRKSSLTKVIDNTNFLAFFQYEWIITKLVNSRWGVHARAGGFVHFFCGLNDSNVDSSLAKFQRKEETYRASPNNEDLAVYFE